MISLKRVLVFAVFFLVLIILYFFTGDSSLNRKKQVSAGFFPEFDRSSAVSILITSPDGRQTSLKLRESVWEVVVDNATFKADMSVVTKLFDAVEKMKSETIVSKNPAKFSTFEVTEGKGIEVRIRNSSGSYPAFFYVGKSGPDIFSTYVRRNNSDRVILTSGILKTVFEQSLTDWRDKTIFKLNKADVTEYRIDGELRIHLKKDDKNGWLAIVPESVQIKNEVVEEAINRFSGLDAVDFPDGTPTEFGLDNPRQIITAVLKSGESETLFVGKDKNAFQLFVKIKDSEQIYLIEKHILATLSPLMDNLRKLVE